jgi:hypothetical protein
LTNVISSRIAQHKSSQTPISSLSTTSNLTKKQEITMAAPTIHFCRGCPPSFKNKLKTNPLKANRRIHERSKATIPKGMRRFVKGQKARVQPTTQGLFAAERNHGKDNGGITSKQNRDDGTQQKYIKLLLVNLGGIVGWLCNGGLAQA